MCNYFPSPCFLIQAPCYNPVMSECVSIVFFHYVCDARWVSYTSLGFFPTCSHLFASCLFFVIVLNVFLTVFSWPCLYILFVHANSKQQICLCLPFMVKNLSFRYYSDVFAVLHSGSTPCWIFTLLAFSCHNHLLTCGYLLKDSQPIRMSLHKDMISVCQAIKLQPTTLPYFSDWRLCPLDVCSSPRWSPSFKSFEFVLSALIMSTASCSCCWPAGYMRYMACLQGHNMCFWFTSISLQWQKAT